MKAVLHDFGEANANNWPTFLPIATRQINTHAHSAIGTSPYHIIFGTRMTLARGMQQGAHPFQEMPKVGTYLANLDNALNAVYQRGLAQLEDKILSKFSKAPETLQKFATNEYVLLRNLRLGSDKNKKFATRWLGPIQVEEALIGDFYRCRDLVQDSPVFCHARDMQHFECSPEAALDLARRDSNEFFVAKVVGHQQEGDTTNLESFRFIVTFTDDPGTEHALRFRDLKHVEAIKSYIRSTPELKFLVPLLDVDESTPKRVRKTNRLLQDFAH